MTFSWRDPKTINAVESYTRIAVSVAFAIILLLLFIKNGIDIDTILRAITALLMINNASASAFAHLKSRSDPQL